MVSTDQMETEIHQAIAEMKYVRDVRATPNPRNKEQFRIGWEHAAVHGTQDTDHTLHTLTWRNAGYRLGKKFGDQPEYMNAAYAILAEQFPVTTDEAEKPVQRLGKEAFSKVDQMLDAFARYRAESEERYLKDERTYKENLFTELAAAWDVLLDEPARSHEMLLSLMRGENPATRRAIDNLLGGRGFAARDNFRAFLEDIDSDEYLSAMEQLFDRSEPITRRLRQFRELVSAEYRRLHAEGKLHKSLKKPPRVSQSFAGILLASYDPNYYIPYRNTEYRRVATWLGLQVPGSPEHAYAVFLDMAHDLLAHAQERQAPVHDLIDVHNMIYVLFKYGEFAAHGTDPDEEDTSVTIRERAANESIYDFIYRHHFVFPDWLVTSYVLSLATKPFVILSGISGTGKTKLAQLLADYTAIVTANDGAQTYVAVRPDWTDNSHLLGWYNAITERYEKTPVLETIIRAADAPKHPHFIILDEMNIARVEHYFSDFLSCMESRLLDDSGRVRQAPLQLHNQNEDDDVGDDVPPFIELPLNIYVTGTVNVDETTYMFSPKVLDRANVIEFNEVLLDPDEDSNGYEPGAFVLRPEVTVTDLFKGHKPATTAALAEMRTSMPEQFTQLLTVHAALRPYNMHFGYRVANEIASFMLNAQRYCVDTDVLLSAALDLQILQKILPKLHGNVAQLQEPLERLLDVLAPTCRMSRAKVQRMQMRLEQIGFASFIE